MSKNIDTTLHVESDDYAWSQCAECGNTIKFGQGAAPVTVCPGCGTEHTADRKAGTVAVSYIPTDEEFWAEQDAWLDY